MSKTQTQDQPDPSFPKRTVVVITVSDKGAEGLREDHSGQVVTDRLRAEGYDIKFRVLVPDDKAAIVGALNRCSDQEKVALAVTTGGTGVSPRDVTPEATLEVVQRLVPGMAEAMRAASLAKTPHAMLSRGVVGIRNATLIVNLPGSPAGAMENLEVILPAIPHALAKIQGDPSDCGR
ncbi:MAG TPA: molybdenum cofactor biosynthesis protein [Syntrophobacteraceae bacterium]|nr:molybdenum cofactor biosynthesis protein [Syntrophobacteraceae bacterium]HBD07612.1 molybdenum cofactor biosynthesis protein [Syntrophobacteraceae bacterium]HBZ54782.1 molybdenum cofactor biosynthesis protein [Syntrophobacteraceae bacterium]